ncbi:MAG: response regulator [Lachnospiraceae bacterium]|nr:response regulator [Lachnospiraceae bacterium]
MKILLAVPDRDLLQAYERLLGLNGHEVTAVFDGIQAVTQTAGHRYDAAVFDVKLSRVSPEQLLELFREERIPAVILSKTPKDRRTFDEKYPGNRYLNYPFLPEELEEKLKEIASAQEWQVTENE